MTTELLLPRAFKNRIKTGGLILSKRFTESHFDLTPWPIEIKVRGEYLVEVCRDGKVIRQPFGPKMRPNLITNTCLDGLINFGSADPAFYIESFAHVGTSTTPPAVTDIKLGTETQNTSNRFTGAGHTNACSQDNVAGTWTQTLQFEFPASGSAVTLNECGVANVASSTSGLCTHILFPSGVSLNVGDNIRLTYALIFSLPMLVTAATISQSAMNGFNPSGSLKWLGIMIAASGQTFLGTISAAGTISGSAYGQNMFFDAAAQAHSFLSAPSTFPAVGTNQTDTTISASQAGNVTLATYTTGSFTRNQTWTWNPANPSSTVSNIQQIRFISSGGNGAGLYLLLNALQTKANTNTLSFTISLTLSRV